MAGGTKIVIVIPDGCADEPQASLGNRTPLQAAKMPHAARLAREGRVGRANNVPPGLTPASDVATLSLFGYDPLQFYTGRAPLEAAALGVQLGPHDWAIRCNLVTVEDEALRDFTAGHVSSAEGKALLDTVRQALGSPEREFVSGVSYRNLLVYRGRGPGPFGKDTRTQAPHDIPDRPIADYLPAGPGAEILRDLMQRSRPLFADHPVNRRRVAQGQRPATQIWLWGQGQAPALPPFRTQYGPRGVILTGVDLVRGVGALLGWDRLDVPGVTDYLDNDYAAQGKAAVEALDRYDLVCVHVEAPDEASHEGKVEAKIEALERIDEHVVGPLRAALDRYKVWRMLVSPDHPTPVRTRAHAHGFVPFVIAGSGIAAGGATSYDEVTAAAAPPEWTFDPGWHLMRRLLG
jgi:2,3-bisphosphoglycerate-independent phosphoglycerate mutase